MVVELALNDGHTYQPHSLQAAGIHCSITLKTPFLNSIRDLDREGRWDPARWELSEAGLLPQVSTNYLIEHPHPLPRVSVLPQVAEPRAQNTRMYYKPRQRGSFYGIYGMART